MNFPIKIILVGFGHRGQIYADYSLLHSDDFRVVGVVDPDPFRRQAAACRYQIPEENCIESVSDLVKKPLQADAAINGTMDKDHVPTSLLLLEAGYSILLEKPIGITQEEVLALLNKARTVKKTVMICHILRYAPFYQSIKQQILAGRIGQVINIQTAEHVSYHHISAAFVRGKWNRKDRSGSSMLMAKCCHDLDLLTWMKSPIPPQKVSSFGGRMYFRPEQAPKDAGTRCLVDCPIEPQCLYSARKLYLDHPDRWGFYVWSFLEHIENPTIEQKIESLKTDNPHGRCIWKCDNDVVDHQSVMVKYFDGATATHTLVGGASRPCRKIHILGTEGEIEGVMEDGFFLVKTPDLRPEREYSEERIEIKVNSDMHGGGDLRLVDDFIRVLRGQEPSFSTTHLEDSIYGHLIGFAADRAMAENKICEIPEVKAIDTTKN